MKAGFGIATLSFVVLAGLPLMAQQDPSNPRSRQDRPLRSDFYPKRLDPEERHESGFFGSLNPQFIIFSGLGSDIYEWGQQIMLEGGYYWEKSGIYAAVGVYGVPWGHANNDNLDAGPPIGTFEADLEIYMIGVFGRFGNGSWPGWHFGVSGGGGMCLLSESVVADNGSLDTTTHEQGIMYRGGLFLERDLINNEDLGLLLGLTFDYYWTGIEDVNDDPINFWSIGLKLTFALRPGVKKARELPDED